MKIYNDVEILAIKTTYLIETAIHSEATGFFLVKTIDIFVQDATQMKNKII